MVDFKTSTQVKVVDKASPALKRLSAQAEISRDRMDRLRAASIIPAMAAKRAGSLAANLGKLSLAGGLAGGALGLSVQKHVNQIDALAKLGKQTGLSAQTLDEFGFAVERQGGTIEQFNSGLGAFSKRMGELRAGTGSLNGFLKKTDSAFAEQLKGAESNEQALTLFLDKLASLPDEQAKAAFAAAAVSRGASRTFIRLTQNGSAEITKLREQARRLAPPITDEMAVNAELFADGMTNVSRAAGGVGRALSSSVVPILTPFTERMAEWVANNQELIKTNADGFASRLGTGLASIDFDAVAHAGERFTDGMDAVAGAANAVTETLGGVENAAKLLAAGYAVHKSAMLIDALSWREGMVGHIDGVEKRHSGMRDNLGKKVMIGGAAAVAVAAVSSKRETEQAKFAERVAELVKAGNSRDSAMEIAEGELRAATQEWVAGLPVVRQVAQGLVRLADTVGVPVNESAREVLNMRPEDTAQGKIDALLNQRDGGEPIIIVNPSSDTASDIAASIPAPESAKVIQATPPQTPLMGADDLAKRGGLLGGGIGILEQRLNAMEATPAAPTTPMLEPMPRAKPLRALAAPSAKVEGGITVEVKAESGITATVTRDTVRVREMRHKPSLGRTMEILP